MKNLTIENITDNVNLINSGCPNPRLKFLIEKLVQHSHDYVRETRLSMVEWNAAIEFMTKCGQTCTDLRQEVVLLCDVLGLSLLVDAVDHPKHDGATEGTVMGPFHTDDAHDKPNGENIDSDPDGTPLLVVLSLKDSKGRPVEGATVDVWQTDSHGVYDVQYSNRDGPHGRAVLHSDKDGSVWFQSIVPVSYPVPVDGPVGDLLRALNRHPYRPAHMHFMIAKEGFDHFIT